MEYIVAGGVTALFVILFLATLKKEREQFSHALKEDEFARYCKHIAENLPPPTDGGKPVSLTASVRAVKRTLKIPKSDDGELLRLQLVLEEGKESVLKLAKEDFSTLENLPQVNGTPRAVLIAETVLGSSRYIFSADRAKCAVDAFNAARTLTFSEAEALQKCFVFVLMRKLGWLAKRIEGIEKMKSAGEKIAGAPSFYARSRLYGSVKGRTVFSRFCADALGYDTEKFVRSYREIADNTAEIMQNVLDSLENVRLYDFSVHYEPLVILSRYDAFSSATQECRAAFLKKLGELSAKENLDELAYALRLENYAKTGTLPPVRALRMPFGKGKSVFAPFKGDLLLLAHALTSPALMQLLFGEGSRGQSILKNAVIKNSFMPKTRTFCADFALSTDGDTLSVHPDFPEEILTAECVLRHKGVEHRVIFRRGEPGVEVNGTLMQGVNCVKLGKIPLTVTVTMPEKAKRGIEPL